MQSLLVGTLVAQRYRVLGELGRGGMGVVYRVEHVHTGQRHALKVLNVPAGLSEELVLRFKREARAPARIKSEHVVTITDADVMPEHGNAPFLVMELLDGVDLEHVLEERGCLPPRETLDALAQVARVLDRAHALGIVHRDLKPENLFFHRREDGSTLLKVLDFGISKVADADDPGALTGRAVTRPGALMGTPLYMSPEQAGSGTKVGPASDVWSLGIVAVRLLTGDYYWKAQSMGELMAQLLRDPMYLPSARWPWLPEGFDEWFARSCDRDPARRFTRASEQVAGLAAVLGERVSLRVVVSAPPPSGDTSATVSELGATTPVEAPSPSSPLPPASTSPSAPRAKRRGRGVVVAALVFVAATGLALARWAPSPPPARPLATAPSSSASSVTPLLAPNAWPTSSSSTQLLPLIPTASSSAVLDTGRRRLVPHREAGLAAPPALTSPSGVYNPVAP